MQLSLFDPGKFHDPTIPSVVEAYIAAIHARVGAGDFSAAAYENTIRDLRLLSSAMPNEVSCYRQSDLESWIVKQTQWTSGHTKKRVVAEIIACFSWAADPERGSLIESNPFRKIRAIASIPYVARRPATLDEFKAILRHSGPALRLALIFCWRTGCRPCEMRELIWPWVVLDSDIPRLVLQKHKTIRKTGQPKIVGLDNACVKMLTLLRDRAKCQHVFTNAHGTPWSRRTFCQAVHRAVTRAGIDTGEIKRVSAGCFRTSFACDLIELGFSNKEVADSLGHSSTWMVDHVYASHTRQSAVHLDRIAKRAEKLRK